MNGNRQQRLARPGRAIIGREQSQQDPRLIRSPRRRGRAASAALSRPSILAVWALMTSSNLRRLHDRQVGGLLALEDAAGIDADLTPRIRDAGSVAHQPADFGKFTPSHISQALRGAPPAGSFGRAGW